MSITMEGFLNLNKPAGLTSHDCIARSRRLLRLKRIGHAGTLDPAATGVLPIALGKATRLLQFLRSDKAYQATIRLGMRTNTDDLEGEILATQSASSLDLATVETALLNFQGKIQQIPPNYSAIQVAGKRLYDLARAGETIEVPARTVEVFKIEVLDWHPGEFADLVVNIACGSGTYIRAIARDLGLLLGVGGTLAKLIRTESCGFQLADSLTFEDLESQLEQESFKPMAIASVLGHLTAISLPATFAKKWCNGQRILWDAIASSPVPNPESQISTHFRVEDENNNFLGIGQLINSPDGELLIPQVVF